MKNKTEDIEPELYHVERILAKRKNGKVMEYYTKWVGYDKEEDNTWEPIASFIRCPWVVEQFEAEQMLVRGLGNDLINEMNKSKNDDEPNISGYSNEKNNKK